MGLIRGNGGGGLSELPPQLQSFSDALTWDDERRRAKLDGSFQVLPSTFFMGNFALSNGVKAAMYQLADGTKAIGLLNRFNPSEGSISNPKFFALGAQSTLQVETVSTGVIADGFELQYTTAGDNLTYDFDFIPASAGMFKAEYWIGADDTGNKVFDEQIMVTQEQVDAGQPIPFVVGNPYILEAGTQLFVRFTGIDFKGNSATGLPYFVSKILPYKEITLGGYTWHTATSITLLAGCNYAPDVTGGNVTLTVPLKFTDNFRVYDYKGAIGANKVIVDLSAHGAENVELIHKDDDVEFFYIPNDGWYINDIKGQQRVKVPVLP